MSSSLDLQLVMMPYQALERPSPALGILVASVRQAGFTVRGAYPGLQFAECIGLESYRRLADEYLHLVGEWTFAEAAFPEAKQPPEYFFAHVESLAATQGTRLPFSREELLSFRVQANRFVKQEAEKIVNTQPKIVGCGTQFQQTCSSLALLREVKALNPTIITLLGGQCCSGEQGKALQESVPFLDLVFSGEADSLLPQVIEQLLEYGVAIPADKLLPGVITATGFLADAEGVPLYPVTEDMDSVPTPCHDDYFNAYRVWSFRDELPAYIAFEGGRGCQWAARTGGCSFCSTAQERACFRPKSPDRLLAELYELKDKYQITAFEAADEMCNPDYFNNFFPRLAAMATPPFLLSFDVRATLREAEVVMLRDAGCVWLQPGIESLADGALQSMRKGISAAAAIRLLRLNMENGISTSWNILRGFPGELTAWYEGMAELIPALVHLEPPNAYARLRIDRNSIFQREPSRFGLTLRPSRVFKHVFPFDEAVLERLASFFEADQTVGMSEESHVNRHLEQVIITWKNDFYGNADARPRLELCRSQGKHWVLDTRPCAVQRKAALSKVEVSLLAVCRDPVPEANAMVVFQERGLDENEPIVAEVLQSLLKQRFILSVGNRLVTVVAKEPRFPLPTPEEVMTGRVQLR